MVVAYKWQPLDRGNLLSFMCARPLTAKGRTRTRPRFMTGLNFAVARVKLS